MSALTTSPDTFEIARSETLPLGVDMAALLLGGETIGSPAATLTDYSTGLDVTADGISGSASTAGGVVTQTLLGSGLTAGRMYRLAVSFVAGGKHWTTETLIRCVF